MNAPNKMMIAVGALALTATTLLAGCGGSSSASTVPAESAEVAAPASITEGLLKPADIADEQWALIVEGIGQGDLGFADLTPEELEDICKNPASQETTARRAEESAQEWGGSVEGWSLVWATLDSNRSLMACSMAE